MDDVLVKMHLPKEKQNSFIIEDDEKNRISYNKEIIV